MVRYCDKYTMNLIDMYTNKMYREKSILKLGEKTEIHFKRSVKFTNKGKLDIPWALRNSSTAGPVIQCKLSPTQGC